LKVVIRQQYHGGMVCKPLEAAKKNKSRKLSADKIQGKSIKLNSF
jgi:hypothetical protein